MRLTHIELHQRAGIEIGRYRHRQPRLSITRSEAGLPLRALPPVTASDRAAKSGHGSGFDVGVVGAI
jgi:hypothetical protein